MRHFMRQHAGQFFPTFHDFQQSRVYHEMSTRQRKSIRSRIIQKMDPKSTIGFGQGTSQPANQRF